MPATLKQGETKKTKKKFKLGHPNHHHNTIDRILLPPYKYLRTTAHKAYLLPTNKNIDTN